MRSWIISIVSFTCYFVSNAQDSLKLSQALRMALNTQHGIQLAQTDIQIAQLKNNWSETGFVPEVHFNFTPTLSFNSVDQKLVNNTEIRRDNARSEQINANITFNWNFFKGFGMSIAKNRLEQEEVRSTYKLEIEVLKLTYDVALNFYDILRIQNLAKITKEQLSIAQLRLDDEKYRLDNNSGNRSNYISAQLDYKEIELALTEQQHEEELAYIKLYQLTGMNPKNKPHLIWNKDDSLNLQWKHLDFSQIQHPELSDLLSQGKILELTRKEDLAGRWPSLSLFGSYNFNRTVNQAGFNLFSQNYGPLVQLQMNFPLYNGGIQTRKARETSLLIKKNKIEIDQWQTNKKLEFDLTVKQMEYYYSKYLKESEKSELAKTQFQIVQDKYKLRTVSNLELRQSQFELIKTQTSMEDARFQWKALQLYLMTLKGDLTELMH